MREIKMRIWNPSGKNMLYDVDNVLECLKQQLEFDKSMPDRGFVVGYDHRREGMVWELFTGFKDSKGKEIYDGDIIGDWYDCDGVKTQSKQQVFFHEEKGQWMIDCSLKQNKSSYFPLAEELKNFEFEIIGNIHEKI